MGILDKRSNAFKIDSVRKRSTKEEIEKLILYSSIEVPREFLELIGETEEIDIHVDEEKHLKIWGANGCIEMNTLYKIQEYIPNSLAFADDGGGCVLIYAKKNNVFGVYMVALNDPGIDELVFVSPSLEEFFSNNIGVDIFNSFFG